MSKSVLQTLKHSFTRIFRAKTEPDPAREERRLEQALLQMKRERRFGTHDEERFLGRDMVARWKCHRLWG